MISEAMRDRVRKIAEERLAAKERGEKVPSVEFVAREIVDVPPVTSRYTFREVERGPKGEDVPRALRKK